MILGMPNQVPIRLLDWNTFRLEYIFDARSRMAQKFNQEEMKFRSLTCRFVLELCTLPNTWYHRSDSTDLAPQYVLLIPYVR